VSILLDLRDFFGVAQHFAASLLLFVAIGHVNPASRIGRGRLRQERFVLVFAFPEHTRVSAQLRMPELLVRRVI
jgi:hypothetical protein